MGLIGCTLLHRVDGVDVGGIIVETEAYDQTDAASHSFSGQTRRNRAMFNVPGTAYVYRSYGLHWCINITCGPMGFGAAVLVRALRPTKGIDTQYLLRGLTRDTNDRVRSDQRLCRGPGNLTRALGINMDHNMISLLDPKSPLRLKKPKKKCLSLSENKLYMAPRVGIQRNKNVHWRFFWANEKCVSSTRKGFESFLGIND